jgi:hypothetical protein
LKPSLALHSHHSAENGCFAPFHWTIDTTTDNQ